MQSCRLEATGKEVLETTRGGAAKNGKIDLSFSFHITGSFVSRLPGRGIIFP